MAAEEAGATEEPERMATLELQAGVATIRPLIRRKPGRQVAPVMDGEEKAVVTVEV
jgi:hypothetical protein